MIVLIFSSLYLISNLVIRVVLYLTSTIVYKFLLIVISCFNNLLEKILLNKIKSKSNINKLEYSIVFRIHYKFKILLEIIASIRNNYLLRYEYEGIIRYSIKLLFKLRLLNIVCILYAYILIFNGYNVMKSLEDTYFIILYILISCIRHIKLLDEKYKIIIIIILLSPFFKALYCFITIKFKYMKCNKENIEKEFSDLINNIDDNIKNCVQFKYNYLLVMVRDITSDIGFRLNNSKLEKVNIIKHNLCDKYGEIKFNKVTDDIESVRRMIRNICNKDINFQSEMFGILLDYLKWKIKVDFCNIEHIIIEYKNNNDYKACKEYFDENNNPIYKHLFTEARVIRKKPLESLDWYIERCEKFLNDYNEYIYTYIYELMIIRKITINLWNKTVEIAFPRAIIFDIFTILKLSFKRYLKIFFTIAY